MKRERKNPKLHVLTGFSLTITENTYNMRSSLQNILSSVTFIQGLMFVANRSQALPMRFHIHFVKTKTT